MDMGKGNVAMGITSVFILITRHRVLLSSIAAFLCAYLYITVNCNLSAPGKMADIQADSHEELPPHSPPPPTSTHSPPSPPPTPLPPPPSAKEKIGNTQENSTEDLTPPPSSPLPSSPPSSPPRPSPFAAAASPQRYEGQESAGFKLTETCLLFLHRGDITKWFIDGHFDAIVNAANKRLLGGGGVDGAIHSAAGPDLLTECKNIPEVRPGVRCPVGRARITRGFQLSVSHIIHTVGPIYHLEEDPECKLSEAYRSSLDLARVNELKYIAFPAISCGIYGYPYEEAAEVSLTTVRDFANDLKEVHFVLFEAPAWEAWVEKANELFEQT